VPVEVVFVPCTSGLENRQFVSSPQQSRASSVGCLLKDAHCRAGSQAVHGQDCTYTTWTMDCVHSGTVFSWVETPQSPEGWVAKRGQLEASISWGARGWGCRRESCLSARPSTGPLGIPHRHTRLSPIFIPHVKRVILHFIGLSFLPNLNGDGCQAARVRLQRVPT
jgi:hypothetical protein